MEGIVFWKVGRPMLNVGTMGLVEYMSDRSNARTTHETVVERHVGVLELR